MAIAKAENELGGEPSVTIWEMVVPGDELTEWANLIQQARSRFLGPQEPNPEGTQPQIEWDGESLLASVAAPPLSPAPANSDFGSFSDARRLVADRPVDPSSTVKSRKASSPVSPETPYRLTSDGSSLPL